MADPRLSRPAAIFRRRMLSALPGAALSFEAVAMPGVGLAVRLTRCEALRFDPRFLEPGAGLFAGGPTWSPLGEHMLRTLRQTGEAVVRDHGAPGDVFALITTLDLADPHRPAAQKAAA